MRIWLTQLATDGFNGKRLRYPRLFQKSMHFRDWLPWAL